MRLPDPDRSRAVLIGTRNYVMGSGLAELPGVTGNVNGLASALIERTGLRPAHCLSLVDRTDDRAVCLEVRRAADEAEDLLLVYFAGHGLIGHDGHELFLALSHSDPADPLFNSVRFAELRELIARSPARNRVLILDCCYSGRAIGDRMAGAADEIAFAQTEVSGTYTLTATSATMTALAPIGERTTLFTGALLELLRTGLDSNEPYLTLGSLYARLRRTLQPRPRQQGTDTAAALALGVNPAYRAPTLDAAPMASSNVSDAEPETPTGEWFTSNPQLAPARRLLAVLRWLPALVAACLVDLAWLGGFGNLGDPRVLGIVVLCVGLVVFALRCVQPRLPRRYELTVDRQGLQLTVDAEINRILWHDVQRITTVRSNAGRRTPNRVVLWPRRGFVPSTSQACGPRMDRGRSLLWFCRPGWLSGTIGDVESAIARHAPALWDDAHGLRSTLNAAVFGKSHAVRAAPAFWGVLFSPIAAIGVLGISSDGGWAIRAIGVGWLTCWSALAGFVLLIGILPLWLHLDERGLRVRGNFGRLDVTWAEIEAAAILPGEYGPELVVRTARRPVAPRLVSTKLSVPYDPQTQLAKINLGALAALPVELDAAFSRFAGSRWLGERERLSDATPPGPGRDYTLTGRLAGPRFRTVLVVGLSTAMSLPVYLADVMNLAASSTLAVLVMALTVLVSILSREWCELRIDPDGIELRTSAARTRIAWTQVSWVDVRRISKFTLTGPAPAIVVWLKDGARIPPKWRWRQCFVPHSGGVAIVNVQAFDGVAGPLKELLNALTHFAGPERTTPAYIDPPTTD